MFPFIMQGNNISIVIDNVSHTISKSHITYEKVKQAIKDQDWDLVREIIEPKKVIINFGAGNLEVNDGEVSWKGKPMHNALTTRMIAMLEEGFSIEPLANFMANLMDNPSYRSINELYGFLENNNLPITPDGHFLAYKKVQDNFLDIHSSTMDNSIGNVLEMERNAVDDDQNQTCSSGLHFCSQSYLAHFGGSTSRTIIVKINPRDVVSIPNDYNNAKGRTCRYEVIGELGVDASKAFTQAVQSEANTEEVKVKAETAAPWFNWPKAPQ
jgi:hypothetical protein